MDEIKDLLSEKRLAKYKGNSTEDALKHHLYNSELAESFYQSLSYFEIILRNKIDFVFSKYLGKDWIFDNQYYVGKNKKHYEDAFKRIEREKGVTALSKKDTFISEFPFGFWSFLFSDEYNDVIWKKHPQILKEIFEYEKSKLPLSKYYRDINKIRIFRNKVFHYGSLIAFHYNDTHLGVLHNFMYNIMKNMGANKILKSIKNIDNFNATYKKGKELQILK